MTTATAFQLETLENKQQRVVIDGVEVRFISRGYNLNRREYAAKAQAYGVAEALAPELDALEPKYIAYTDENSTDVQRVQEQMWRAWRDSTKRIATERLSQLIEKLQHVEGLVMPQSADVKFSYKAGCSCGCSPGWVLSDTVRQDKGWRNVDLYLSRVDEIGEK